MTLILRHIKQSPLTSDEMDGNFEDLDRRLKRFETQTETLEGIQSLKMNEGKMVITGTQGSLLGEVPLPVPSVTFKGQWKPGAPYMPHDIVNHEEEILLCISATDQEVFTPQEWVCLLDLRSSLTLPVCEEPSAWVPQWGRLLLLKAHNPCLLIGGETQWFKIPLTPL